MAIVEEKFLWNGIESVGARFKVRNISEGTASCMISMKNANTILSNSDPSFFTPDGHLHFHQEVYPWKLIGDPILYNSANIVPIRTNQWPIYKNVSYYGLDSTIPLPQSGTLNAGLRPHIKQFGSHYDYQKPTTKWPPFIPYGDGITVSPKPITQGPALLYGKPLNDYYQYPVVYELKPYTLSGHELEFFVGWTGGTDYQVNFNGLLTIEPHPSEGHQFNPITLRIYLKVENSKIQSIDFVDYEEIAYYDRLQIKAVNHHMGWKPRVNAIALE